MDLEKYKLSDSSDSPKTINLEKYKISKKQTAGGKLLRDATRTPVRLLRQSFGATKAAGQLLTGDMEGSRETLDTVAQGSDSEYFGELKPVGMEGSFGERVKDSVGAGLEMASYLPITRAVTAPIKGAQTAFNVGRKELGKQATGSFVDRVTTSAKSIGKDIGSAAKTSGIEGGFGATTYETGRQLMSDEKLDPLKIALVGAGGVVGGGALGTVGGLLGATGSRVLNTRDEWKNIFRPKGGTEDLIKQRLPTSFETAFGETSGIRNTLDKIGNTANRMIGRSVPENTISKQMTDLATEASKETGEVFDRTKLFGELFDNKYGVFIPEVDGKMANMDTAKREIAGNVSSTAKTRDNIYRVYEGSSVDPERLIELAVKQLDDSNITFGTYQKSKAEIIKTITDNTEQGKSLNPRRLQDIITTMADKSKAFTRGKYEEDARLMLSRAAKDAMRDIIPEKELSEVVSLTSDLSQLKRMEKTANALHNQKMNVPYLIGKLGSLGTLFVVGGITKGAMTGSMGGGLVLAGILATLGERYVAGVVRNSMFNPQIKGLLQAGMKQNPEMLQRVVETISKGERRAFINQVMNFDIDKYEQSNKRFLDELSDSIKREAEMAPNITKSQGNFPATIEGGGAVQNSGFMEVPEGGFRTGIRDVLSPNAQRQASQRRGGVRETLQLPEGRSENRIRPTSSREPLRMPPANRNQGLRDFLGF